MVSVASPYDVLKASVKETWLDWSGALPKRGPDFFIMGASRSGTTYLHNMLNLHSDIFLPQSKELHYFDRNSMYRENLKGYRGFFAGYEGERKIGEVTPFYFYAGMLYDRSGQVIFGEESAARRISRHFPDAQIIITLRNPYTRLLSMYNKNYYQGKISTSLQDALKSELVGGTHPTLLYRNRYDIHVKDIIDHFPAQNVKIIIFEEWIDDQQAAMDDICAFLDIPAQQLDSMPDQKSRNIGKKYRLKNQEKYPEADIKLDKSTQEKLDEALMAGQQYIEKLLGRALPWESTSA